MRLTSACLALTLAGLLTGVAALPAAAGDLDNDGAGGIRDYSSGGVPVPVPQVYDENYKWYVRGDFGTGFKSSGTSGNDGLPVSFAGPKDWTELSIVSFGFGRYVTPSLRTEFTMDFRPDRNLAAGTRTPSNFTQTFSQTNSGVTTTAINAYTGTQSENITLRNYTYLASAFYDFNRDGRLRPYIGAGVGFAFNQLTRNGGETYTCQTGITTVSNGPPPVIGCNAAAGPAVITSSSAGTAIKYGLAAQLSAGVTYDVTPRIHWDTGYRMLWQGGHVAVVSSEGLNTVSLGDHVDHEVRSGLRWDLW